MTKVSKRKTRLEFETDATVRSGGYKAAAEPGKGARRRYVSVQREIIVEVNSGHTGTVRLKGTRVRYEFSWLGLHDWAAELHARREKARRKKEREERRRAGR